MNILYINNFDIKTHNARYRRVIFGQMHNIEKYKSCFVAWESTIGFGIIYLFFSIEKLTYILKQN